MLAVVSQILVACAGAATPSNASAPETRAAPTTTAAAVTPSPPRISRSPSPKPTETTVGIRRIDMPDFAGGLVVVGETVWVATDSGAVRVDPAAGTVSEVIAGVTNLAFDGERLWAGGQKLLMELDPRTGRVLRRFTPDYNAFYLAATPEAIWATDTYGSAVRRIDPSDGHVVATIEVPSTPKGTTLGEGSLWIACDGAATVVRIDTTTNQIAAKIKVDFGPHNIAVGDGSVWVTNRNSSTLSKVDASTNQVTATVTDVATSPAVGVVVGPRSVFVAYPGGVAAVDPDRAAITSRIVIEDAQFYDLKLLGDALWASDGSSPTLYGFDLDLLMAP
jgi:YVTN family beta-propeller protein